MRYYLICFVSLFLFSCQEEITVDLPQAENKLVVEGSIEPGFPPYIILSKNQGYFEPINSSTYNDLFISNAIVEIWKYETDGTKDSILLFPNVTDSIIIYTVDASEYDFISGVNNFDFSIVGETYHLQITWDNQIITAETTIPRPTPLDSLWVEQSESSDKDFKSDIRAMYTDPADEQNNILIKSKRMQHYTFNEDSCKTTNKSDFPLQLVDAGSDILINGQSFETYFPRPKENGFPTGQYNSYHTKECDDGTLLELEKDIVLIKFCQIDEASMKFWRGLIRQVGTNGNPFAEPMNLVSNINGGLGIWTGYSPVYYKVPVVIDTTIFEEYSPKIIDIF